MPSRLRPAASLAADAILVGDPGRALLLAQELLEQPKMSNHARGLWGYSGHTAAGGEALTIQSTGMGGPSAAIVLADLAELGVRRAVRIGTCSAGGDATRLGELLLAAEAVAVGGSADAFGLSPGESARPDPILFELLRTSLADAAQTAVVASLDTMPAAEAIPAAVEAVDMQTVAVLARAGQLELAAAAVLIVSDAGGTSLSDPELEEAARNAGRAAAKALSNPQVEG